MPTREQVLRSAELVEAARERLKGVLIIDFVVPDYYASRPKPCMGGWGRGIVNVTPSGKVLPCHAAETIPGLVFDNVRDRPLRDIWLNSQAFQALPRHVLDARALPVLRVPRGRLGRLPLPGVRVRRRCRPHRPGVREIRAACGICARRAGRGLPAAATIRVPQSACRRATLTLAEPATLA